MLSQDDAAKLALSGYSKADIEALGFSFTPATDDNTNESNKPDTSNAAIEALTKTVGELSATVKAMQEANAKGARDDSNPKGNNGQSATDVVKNFIKSM